MNLDIGDPRVLRAARAGLEAFVGTEWLADHLAGRSWDKGPGEIERLLTNPVMHPVAWYLRSADQWIADAEAGRPSGGADRYQFVQTAWLIEAAAHLLGGEDYLASLRNLVVGPRVTARTVRQFRDTLFEAEAALHWAFAGNTVVFGPPGGNPDFSLLVRNEGNLDRPTRVPMECWRASQNIESTNEFDDIWRRVQVRLIKSMRRAGASLKVSIRAHRDPTPKDIRLIDTAVRELIEAAREADGAWVTASTAEEAYQVSVGYMGPLDGTRDFTMVDTTDLDLSVEEAMTIAMRGVQTEQGVRGDLYALALRVDADPGWLRHHVVKNLRIKAEQLRKTTGLLDSPVGCVAVKLPTVDRSTLFEIDEAVRAALGRYPHVEAAVLICTERDSQVTPLDDGDHEIFEAERTFVYMILNDASAGLPVLRDSRAQLFGDRAESRTVIDAETGRMSRVVGPPDDDLAAAPAHWPLAIAEAIDRELNPVEDGFGMVFTDIDQLFNSPGDLLAFHTQSGESMFRLVRDQHLNLRWVRWGGGRLRDHIAIDLRPFRGVEKLFAYMSWTAKEWKLLVGSEREGDYVAGRRVRK